MNTYYCTIALGTIQIIDAAALGVSFVYILLGLKSRPHPQVGLIVTLACYCLFVIAIVLV